MKLLWVLALAVPCLTFDIANPVFDGFPVEKLLGTHYHFEEHWQYPAAYSLNLSWTVRDSRIPDEPAKETPVGKYECPSNSQYCARQVVSNKDGESVVTFFAYDTAEPEIGFSESRWGTSFHMRYSTKLAEEGLLDLSITLECSPEKEVSVGTGRLSYGLDGSPENKNVGMFIHWPSESFCRYGKYIDPKARNWGPYVYLAVASGIVGHLLGLAIMRVRLVGIRQFKKEACSYLDYLRLTVLRKTQQLSSRAKARRRGLYNSLADD